MGPEIGDPEIACQSQLGGVITTGGGFSTYNPTPSWQQEAVTAYFDGLSAAQIPTNGYNPNGRGYPDVSLIGVWYQVVVQGNVTSLFGTSASAPLFAAMVSLTNAARAKDNKPPLGFINPTLYAFGPTNAYFNDVTSGNNKCMADGDIEHAANATCCESGFYATAGWDPLTGFGSIQYPNLAEMIDNAPVSNDDKDDTLSTGAIAGIAIGGAAAIALVGAAAYFMMSGGSAAAAGTAAAAGSVTNPVAASAGAY
jgi:tripeptidyl-peptidase-1